MRAQCLSRLLVLPLTALCLMPCACETTTHPKYPTNLGNTQQGPPTVNDFSGAGPTASPDQIIAGDPSPGRLQDIGGYILLYFRDNKRMPATLDELRSMPGGNDLNLNSPSGQPYVYYPDGAWSPKQSEKAIIVFDPVKSQNGFRWCLLMTLPKASGALSVEVISLPESNFEEYKPST